MIGRILDKISNRSPRFDALRKWLAARKKRVIASFVFIMHVAGAICSVNAIMSTRTPQGAIAWGISLNTFPYLAVPAYLVFGQSKFDGYELIRHKQMLSESQTDNEVIRLLRERGLLYEAETAALQSQQMLLENLAQMPITRANDADLLIDGEQTFEAIFESIADAKNYILVQFYIMRDDGLGNRLKDALVEKAREGVRVLFLYDGLGSRQLSESYLGELRDAGVETAAFLTAGSGNRFRVNFRNHRKIVVVDGTEAFVGGHNVGDEYIGKHATLTPWRDTHVALRGPVVLECQVSFLEDWRWATGKTPELNWEPEKAPDGDVLALCLPTGPADEFETGTLMLLNLINTARERVWIASPYFVPDEQFISALQLAALRGVDVRIIIPENNDDSLVDLTSYSYLEELEKVGIKMFRYQPGFMHQKVLLIDEATAAIGTANFDNRSMRLNFEVTVLLHDIEFTKQVETMLEADLEKCRPFPASDYTKSSLPFRFFVRVARLLSPVQ